MSVKIPKLRHAKQPSKSPANLFAALGDETRLLLVTKLSHGQQSSISQLSEGFDMSRQAITKHLHILKDAGIVQEVSKGREHLFILNPQQLEELRDYLNLISTQWDEALLRFKAYLEK